MTLDYGLSKFGDSREEAKRFYAAYVLKLERPEELNELRNGFKDGQILGGDDFLELVREKNAIPTNKDLSLKVILKAVCLVLEIQEDMVLTTNKCRKASFARGVISIIASKTGKTSIEEIALLMNRDGSTISSLLSRFSRKYTHSSLIQDLIEKAKLKAVQIAELQA